MAIQNYDQRLEKRHHPENFEPFIHDQHEPCSRCGEKDEDDGGTANMVDGKLGLCAVCADDMGA